MGIFDRLGDVIRSYLNDDEGFFRKSASSPGRRDDPDFADAWEELDDFLRGHEGGRAGGSGADFAGGRPGGRDDRAGEGPPEHLRKDFEELGVSFGAAADECKTAYKRLLKLHHPDRHAGHPGNMKKATEKSARINTAYDRIEAWRGGRRL